MLHDFKPSDDGLDKARRKAEINRLLSSGQMSQQEFEYLKDAAKQFINFLK